MTSLFEKAYAKVNLTLDVLDKRPDGYHNLKSVMQTISLCDEIQIDVDTCKPWSILCDKAVIPTDERNLAWKAARVFFDALGHEPDGIEIRIEKHIPSEAGLGGGSADAAAVLRALNRYYDEPFDVQRLAQIGSLVGSDVPFCVMGGTVLVQGRGEILSRLTQLPECWFVVIKPEFSCSTATLYRRLDESPIPVRPDHEQMDKGIVFKDLSLIAKSVFNVFDPVVASEQPVLNQIKKMLDDPKVLCCQMSGSGSAVFAMLDDEERATFLFDRLKKQGLDVYIAKPV